VKVVASLQSSEGGVSTIKYLVDPEVY
jgi:hypothetical protein